ncbi:Rid family detoxifying hydrolase [Porticoccaceae bacterium]|nr:Rid family detoxifying hydrolase [Porticoccaceae bacterium]
MNTQNNTLLPIVTNRATAPGGHYSQAMAFQGLIFVSAQLGFMPGRDQPLVGSVEEQTKHCLENLRQILLAAGSDLNHVIKTTIYVSNVDYWPRVNQVYAEVFGTHKPARAIVPCNPLHHSFDVEIEAIATQK